MLVASERHLDTDKDRASKWPTWFTTYIWSERSNWEQGYINIFQTRKDLGFSLPQVYNDLEDKHKYHQGE